MENLMAGRGPSPKAERRRRVAPKRGEWQAQSVAGWQHGDIPDPDVALSPEAHQVWQTWMRSWWAANWMPEDLPGLNIVIQLYDQTRSYYDDPYVEKETRKGDSIFVLKPNPTTELRQMMDNFGITPKGQQDRRWQRPNAEEQSSQPQRHHVDEDDPYRHLRAVK